MSKYIKPDIAFQSLTLTSSTSNPCAIENTSNIYECKQQIPDFPEGETIFNAELICFYDQSEMGDLVCYHAPIEGSNIFSS